MDPDSGAYKPKRTRGDKQVQDWVQVGCMNSKYCAYMS